MERPTVGGIFQAAFDGYACAHGLSLDQHKAGRALMSCRTEALGGYDEHCPKGDYGARRYHSCRNRSCPQCNRALNQQWLERIKEELLPGGHYHVIFTLPHELNEWWRYNRVWFSAQLFQNAAESLRQLLADERHLGAEPGMLLAEHTWGRTLIFHPHVHCLVTAGGLRAGRWVDARQGYLVPGRALSALFRGKWLAALNDSLARGELRTPGNWNERRIRTLLRGIAKQRWNVRIEGQYRQGEGVAVYLSRYLRGGPIGDHRLVSFAEGKVTFRYQDHRDGRDKTLPLPTEEFLSRILSHVPPCGRHRIRYYGLYRPGALRQRQAARAQLGGTTETKAIVADPRPREPTCPRCGASLQRTHWRWSKISLLKGAERCYVQPVVGPDTRPGANTALGNTGPPAYIFLHQRVPVN